MEPPENSKCETRNACRPSVDTAQQAGQRFLDREREFRLGCLPTEQPHPKTVRLAEITQQNTRDGVQAIQQVDRDVLPVVNRVLESSAFGKLREAIVRAVSEGKTVYLSGCGATGRVSLLLEAAWRRFWRQLGNEAPDVVSSFPNARGQIHGMITGGDYALVRSVESFEDYTAFGRRQLKEAGVQAADVVVAITEGGETSSVIGTAWQGLDAGAEVFFICNNPADVLIENVPRSREILTDPRVTHINLASGPMAVAGSTRMQATTAEVAAVGAALDLALADLLVPHLGTAACRAYGLDTQPSAYVSKFAALLDELSAPASVTAIAALAEREEQVFSDAGALTYMANDYMLDIFTDTTERAPTFMLPPFRRGDDAASPRSWVFVKHLFLSTREAWEDIYQRRPRCLAWTPQTYADMGASEAIRQSPPRIGLDDLLQFAVGKDDDPSRHAAAADTAALVLVGSETAADCAEQARLMGAFHSSADRFPHRCFLFVGPESPHVADPKDTFHVPVRAAASPLALWHHLAIKLVLNTMSTITMARMGRVVSNWMAHVETTNKKLIDRGTRLISCLSGLDYGSACFALHQTMAELEDWPKDGGEKPSPVALTIERIKRTTTR